MFLWKMTLFNSHRFDHSGNIVQLWNNQTRSTPLGQPLLCCPVRHGRQRGAWVRVPEPPRSRGEEGKGETSEDLLCRGRSAGHLCTRSTTAPATPGSPALTNGLHREEKRKSYAFRKLGLLKHDIEAGSDLAEDRCMSVGHLSEWTSSLRSWWCVWSYAPQQKDPVSPYLNKKIKKSSKSDAFVLIYLCRLGTVFPICFILSTWFNRILPISYGINAAIWKSHTNYIPATSNWNSCNALRLRASLPYHSLCSSLQLTRPHCLNPMCSSPQTTSAEANTPTQG